jgi:hypothetical protein
MPTLHNYLPRQLTYFGLFLVALTTLLGGFVVYNYRYYPAVVAAPGYTITTPTQPGNLLSGSIMRLRADLELGGPCQYHLSGWSEDNILYYEAVCRWRQRQLWAFDPDSDNRPYQVDNLPSVMIANEVIGFPYVWVRDWLAPASGNVQPATETVSEESYRNMIIRGQPVLASPNGRWRRISG